MLNYTLRDSQYRFIVKSCLLTPQSGNWLRESSTVRPKALIFLLSDDHSMPALTLFGPTDLRLP